MIMHVGSKRATIDAGGSRGEEAEVGLLSEDDRIRAGIAIPQPESQQALTLEP